MRDRTKGSGADVVGQRASLSNTRATLSRPRAASCSTSSPDRGTRASSVRPLPTIVRSSSSFVGTRADIVGTSPTFVRTSSPFRGTSSSLGGTRVEKGGMDSANVGTSSASSRPRHLYLTGSLPDHSFILAPSLLHPCTTLALSNLAPFSGRPWGRSRNYVSYVGRALRPTGCAMWQVSQRQPPFVGRALCPTGCAMSGVKPDLQKRWTHRLGCFASSCSPERSALSSPAAGAGGYPGPGRTGQV